MATVTTNTQLRLINQLVSLGTADSSDLMLIQRGLKSYKLSYTDLVNSLPDGSTIETNSNKLNLKDSSVSTVKLQDDSVDFNKIQDIGDDKVIGNVSGGGDPSEIDIVQDLASGNNTNIASSQAIKDYVSNEIDIGQPENLQLSTTHDIDTDYENTSNRKIMVIAVIQSPNDIYGAAAHVGSTQASVTNKNETKNDLNGSDSPTCKAYHYQVSDGSKNDYLTLNFIVPSGWWWRIAIDPDASMIKAESWEL